MFERRVLRRVLAASVEDLRQQTELIEGGTEEGVDQYIMTKKKRKEKDRNFETTKRKS